MSKLTPMAIVNHPCPIW